jgi:hypothetical protein
MANPGSLIYVSNESSSIGVHITDVETTEDRLVEAGVTIRLDWRFPWCNNAQEVRDKALIFRTGNAAGPVLFYIFWDYDGEQTKWCGPPEGSPPLPPWDKRKVLWAGGNANVRIRADMTPDADGQFGSSNAGSLVRVSNQYSDEIHVTDIEKGYKRSVAPGITAFLNWSFPWCTNPQMIKTKALKFASAPGPDGPVLFYIFWDYDNHYTAWTEANEPWKQRKLLSWGGDLDVSIAADRKPEAQAYPAS